MDALAEYFTKTNYNWFFSNEMRVRGKEVFMTDATCRVPSPPGGAMMASMANFTKFLLNGANPDWSGKVICEIVLKSDIVTDTWMRVRVPKELREALMLHNYCEIDGEIWVIPHESKYKEFGSACGWGDTLDEAREMAQEVAKQTKADGLFYDDHVLDKAEEELKKAAL
jgi:predicted RNase H-like HicB family nuclease